MNLTFTNFGTTYTLGKQYWTDYPFVALGDTACKEAPIREVVLLSYDGDKYCKVLVKDNGMVHNFEIKIGYVYTEKRRLT
jgi:hypothetical protein